MALTVKPSAPSDKKKELATKLWEYLKVRQYCTRRELCEKALEWEYNDSNDRKMRDILSILASVKPIISTSDKNTGYKLALEKRDLEAVKHAWLEIDSRIAELEKRKAPLIKFYERHGGNVSPLA